MENGALGVFEPAEIERVDLENFSDLKLPPALSDFLPHGRQPEPVSWEEVRSAFIAHARALNSGPPLQRLYERMEQFAVGNAGASIDLTWFAERIAARPLLWLVIDDLSPSEAKPILRDQEFRLTGLFAEDGRRSQPARKISKFATELSVGLVVRRILKDRLKGARPAGQDLAQAILSLEPRLGLGRAAYSVTTLLAAISGAPGPVSACLLFELLSRQEWRDKVHRELNSLTAPEICSAPTRKAPVTLNFVREVLRMWSFPLIVRRPVKRPLSVAGEVLSEGESYFLSTYLIHRRSEFWTDPDRFDPDRWNGASSASGTFVPFGWGPRTCVGAALGLSQLILLCHLIVNRLEIALDPETSPEIRIGNVAVPHDFHGVVSVNGSTSTTAG